MKNKLPHVVFFLISFLLSAFFLPAAALSKAGSAHNGSINGQITETGTGLELAGVTVRLEPGGQYTTTNALGFFSFSNLQAGTYSLTFNYIGFESKNLNDVHVRDSETTTLRVNLASAPVDLNDVEIKTSVAQPFQSISALDIRTRPVTTTQDVLRMVPGLFIAQHAGGGKAEQMFLRGFDIDHGTDINLSVDGMPVNMVSHAHGQGYADLHFVIPEIIGNVEFKKGPYYADAGDFTTAGLVRFKTTDALDKSFLKVEAGQFATARAVGGFNLLGANAARRNQHAYLASEVFYSDGYFDSPQQFRRLNLFGKYNAMLEDEQRISLSASAFQSSWDASGQIPERAVKSGQIDRFGAIDDNEGGITSRYNFNFEHVKILKNNSLFKNQLYYSNYAFELYSNFTFYLNEPENGDEIRQKESRNIFGYNGSFQSEGQLGGKRLLSELGIFFRNDNMDGSELSRTVQRNFTQYPIALGDINETNTGAFASATWELTPGLSLNAGARFDLFQFGYEDKLDSLYEPKQVNASVLSPKLNLYYDLSKRVRLYINSGYGFHSNDARVVVPQDGQEILPKATGMDVGAIFKPTPTLLFNVAGWYLALDQEFVYVGDEGVVEPGGKTSRYGVDVSARLQWLKYLFADADITYSHARSVDEPEGAQYIPLAPKWTGTGGLSWDKGQGIYGSLRCRYLGDRAANEDNSLTAKGYFLLDAVAGWKKSNWDFGFSAQNLLNAEWKEAQFETESRLYDEPAPVTEINFTPG
ncbi:MAG TPA: TonB-dependent receptor, partial [Saprospiraceae bacterium]|nr:TonB-dependent receptor [Saprospiraceae bacterium]